MEAKHPEDRPTEDKPPLASQVNDDDAPPRPQVVGHRGFKGNYPENSLSAFKGAVESGTDAIELDLALSKDGVVVISHDQSLKRCFGVSQHIPNCDWDYLKNVTMLQEPHEPVPLLYDLLQYLAQPGAEHVWVFLDVKLGNNPHTILPEIAKTIASVPAHPDNPWPTRLILGCWSSAFIPQMQKHLPSYRMALVCFDLHAARRFFPLPNLIMYNVNQQVLMGPLGRGFLEETRKLGKKVIVWTVNSERAMRWCINNGVYGVVTDHPDLCRQLVTSSDTESGKENKVTMGEKSQILGISLLVAMFGWIFKLKYLPRVGVPNTAPKHSLVGAS